MNSLEDPSRGCTLHAELIVTTSLEPSGSDSEIVPLQWESVVAGNSPLLMPLAWSIGSFRKVCAARKNIWKCLDFSIIHSLFEAIFSQDVAKEGS